MCEDYPREWADTQLRATRQLIFQRDYGSDYASVREPGLSDAPAPPLADPSQIKPHSRWRHFATPKQPDLLQPILEQWRQNGIEQLEIARRLIDLFVVSVLVDGERNSCIQHSSS